MNRSLSMFVFGCCTVAVGSSAYAADKVDYLEQIKPILSAKCYACHGALKQEGELRLETRTLMLKGGASGEVIVAGKADESLLIKRITAEEDERMPPSEQAVVLTAEEISLIRTWINQGGETPPEETPGDPRNHWAFKKPVRVDVPLRRVASQKRLQQLAQLVTGTWTFVPHIRRLPRVLEPCQCRRTPVGHGTCARQHLEQGASQSKVIRGGSDRPTRHLLG